MIDHSRLLRPSYPDVALAFSNTVFRGLAAEREPPHVRRRLAAFGTLQLVEDATVADAFDAAYAALIRRYRSEYAFKNELVSKIVFGRHRPSTATALTELRMASSEADIVIVNGTTTVYEIKSDFDSTSRLDGQLSDYSRYSEFINVVASEKRAAALSSSTPPHVGVIAWRQSGPLRVIRPAASNIENLRSDRLFELLRTHEAQHALGTYLGYEPDVPRGHLRRRLSTIFSELEVPAAHSLTVARLRARRASARALTNSPSFPKSLRAAAYAGDISRVGVERILDRMSAPYAILAY